MACPVCDHKMQNLGVHEQRIFWCPRCGTLKMEDRGHRAIERTLWVRHIVSAAKMSRAVLNCSQHTSVKCMFAVDQQGTETPTVRLEGTDL